LVIWLQKNNEDEIEVKHVSLEPENYNWIIAPLNIEVSLFPASNGITIQWIDQTITNEIKSYKVYRSKFLDGPFVEVDPIKLNKLFIGDKFYYRVFDAIDHDDIQNNVSFFYKISAIMADNSVRPLTDTVEGRPEVKDDIFRLLPYQQELEGEPGQNITFNFYVLAEGNFNDNITFSASYPSSQSIPDHVLYSFSKTQLSPDGTVPGVALNITLLNDADLGIYDIDVYAFGGNRSDSIRLKFSVISTDEENGFISTHLKQQDIRLDEQLNANGSLSVRMRKKIDIYGYVIPPEINSPVNIIIQNEYQLEPLTITALTDKAGHYQTYFVPNNVGNCNIFATYLNSNNKKIQSEINTLSVRKSNQSKIVLNIDNQPIEFGQHIKINTKIYPEFENIPIYFQIKKPDSSEIYFDKVSDDNGACNIDIDLNMSGKWEIISWWDGNDCYEGALSLPLYLYPGMDSQRVLIIAGGGKNDNPLKEIAQYLADLFYNKLIDRRLDNDLIYFMSSVADGIDNRVDEVLPTEEKVLNYIESLYQDGPPYQVNDKMPLLIYMLDHGGKDLFQLDSDEYLSASALNQMLDTLQEKTQCEIQIIIDACYSGSFMDNLNHEASHKRIILTSTGEDNPSYNDREGSESFSYYLIKYLSQGYSFGESFSRAESDLNEKPYLFQNQHPEINDIDYANEKSLGGTFIISDLMPNILDHTSSQVLMDTTLTIEASVIDIEDSHCNVWVSILPPNFQVPLYDEFISPLWQLKKLDLLPVPNQENVYAGTYSCFYQKGIYVLTVYASDSAGNIDSEEFFVEVKKDTIPLNWGNMDDNAVIDLADAIMALNIYSGHLCKVNNENSCTQEVTLREILYILQVITNHCN